jgi:hypothetical protein
MESAAGPWRSPVEVPEDPRALILLQVADMRDGRSRYVLVHFVNGYWTFPDRSRLSELQVAVRWSKVNTL